MATEALPAPVPAAAPLPAAALARLLSACHLPYACLAADHTVRATWQRARCRVRYLAQLALKPLCCMG